MALDLTKIPRRWLPKLRFTAWMLAGMTGGFFVVSGAAALIYGFVPSRDMLWIGTAVSYAALPLIAACLVLDRRRARR